MASAGPRRTPGDGPRQARDVMAFGQEVGRALSDGRIIGRAEPFAKVFPSSRAVKRAVGLVAWAVLEDIALDARIDDVGRLVSETNVRRIAANLAISKNTVTQHLATLREYGFVFREEMRDDVSGRYEQSRYVLDPSACIERFTVTPRADDQPRGQTASTAPPNRAGAAADDPRSSGVEPADDGAGGPCGGQPAQATDAESPRGPGQPPHPRNWDTGRPAPRPRNWDTAAVSQVTGHRDLGHNKEVVVEEEQQQPRTGASDRDRQALTQRLVSVGVAPDLAESLAARHPPGQVDAAVRAASRDGVRSPSGFVVTALRDRWDLSSALEEDRGAQRRHPRETEQATASDAARAAATDARNRSDAWAAAISAALDDRQLARAIATVTRPVAGIERRSVPLTRAELLRWAGVVMRDRPNRPLQEALLDDLSRGPTPSEPDADVDLPAPPAPPPQTAADLSARIAACLADRDLTRQPATRGAER